MTARQVRRIQELEARRTTRRELGRHMAMTLGVARGTAQVLHRGLLGRLRWLLTGK